MPEWLLPAVAISWAGLSTVVAWAFATGRLTGATNQQLETLKASVAELRAALDDKADCHRVSDLGRRIQGEHDERKRLVEAMNLSIGNLQVEARGTAERVRAIEDDVKEVRRKVFNGGPALT